jgi:hypothetical protein
MTQLKQNESTNISKLITIAIIVGIFSWIYEYATGEGKKSFRELAYEWRSLFQRRNCIIVEGKYATSVDQYSRRPITVSNTFSKNFRAILFEVVQRIDSLSDVVELKEFATNIIKGDHFEGKEDVKTVFAVSQKAPFMIDQEREIYCTIKEINDHQDSNATTKLESRITKFNISVFSYKTNVAELTKYVRRLKSNYQTHLEEKRKGNLFVYTLNNTEVANEDDDDTVGGWQETQHETMKSFDNLFFDGKQEILKKIDFFVNNKEWYRKNGVPYTLGIGLYGPPGTGKTSFIKSMATLLGRHIISISLSRIKTKKQLQDFYYETQYSNVNDKNTIGFEKKIIVFEDIDCVGDLVLSRKQKQEQPSSLSSEDLCSLEDEDFVDKEDSKLKQEIARAAKYISKKMNMPTMGAPDSRESLTMDDLLNLWDGIRENTGRIMIITTNHYDKLDPALVRPGRIDIALKLDNASRESISEMYSHYYGQPMDPNDLEVIPDRFYSPAEVINFYVSNHENPRGFIERLACSKKIEG